MGVITQRHQENWLLSAVWLKQDLRACRLLPWAAGKSGDVEWQKEDSFIGGSGTCCSYRGVGEMRKRQGHKAGASLYMSLHGLGNPAALQLKNLELESVLKLWEGRTACDCVWACVRACVHTDTPVCVCIQTRVCASVFGWKAETECCLELAQYGGINFTDSIYSSFFPKRYQYAQERLNWVSVKGGRWNQFNGR